MFDALYSAFITGQMRADAVRGLVIITIAAAASLACAVGAVIEHATRTAPRRRFTTTRRTRRA
jgi:hypothetical protein